MKRILFVVIDDFDPWIVGNQEALLLAMYDSILEKSGIGFSMYNSHKILKSLGKTISDNYSVGGILQNLAINKREYNEIKNIKEKLSIYLQNSKSKVVFFIDNIDRAESDNIIFLFKLIGTIFDLPGVLYVLSYDRERVENILKDTKKINPRYIEKIVQQEIKVPSIPKEQLEEVYSICATNILVKYGVRKEDLSQYKEWYSLVSQRVNNLRNFKRLLNSTLGIVFSIDKNLEKNQLLSIETIRFLDLNLYEYIKENRRFFISHDKIADSSTYKDTFNIDKFNDEGKKFFERLFKEYDSYRDILSNLFPYVRKYNSGYDLVEKYIPPSQTETEELKKANIFSAKYFDSYFSYGANDYLKINDTVQDVIDKINALSDKEQNYKYFGGIIRNIKEDDQKEWFERFQNYIDDIAQEKRNIIALSLFENIYYINNSQHFFSLPARDRVEAIIALLLESNSIEEVEIFTKQMYLSYDKLRVINRIIYWLEHSKSGRTDVENKKDILAQTYKSMCQIVESSSVNLYQDKYYVRHNIWGFAKSFENEEETKQHIRNYISSIVSIENIIRIIGDLISESIGTRYGYSIFDENVTFFFEDINVVDELIKNIFPKTDSEKFVLSVYNKYRSGETDEFGESGIYTNHKIILEL